MVPPPSPRDHHSAVWSPAADGMYIFGGFNGSSLAENSKTPKTPSSDITEVFTQLERIKALKKNEDCVFW